MKSITIKELNKIVKKGIKRHPRSFMYYFEPLQVYITFVLLKLKLNRIQVSLLWFFVGILSGVFFLFGTPQMGLIAIFLHYLHTLLDGCDGQVARYEKQFISEEKDIQLWAKGLYLDYVQHIIVDTIKYFSICIGLYMTTKIYWLLICGLILVSMKMFYRTKKSFVLRINYILKNKLKIFNKNDFQIHKENLLLKTINNFYFYIRNGKLFYFQLLVMHFLDLFHIGFKVFNIDVSFRVIFIFYSAFISILGVIAEVYNGYKNLIYNLLLNEK